MLFFEEEFFWVIVCFFIQIVVMDVFLGLYEVLEYGFLLFYGCGFVLLICYVDLIGFFFQGGGGRFDLKIKYLE